MPIPQVMSSALFARNERYRLMGLLVKIRALLWVAVGLPILGAFEGPMWLKGLGVAILIAGAGAPFVVRRGGRFSGVRLSATIDLAASYLIWIFIPVAAVLTVLVTIWTVAVVVFLSPQSTARRFVGAAVLLELSKLVYVFLAPAILDRPMDGLAWTVIGRTAAISATYFVLYVVDEYFSRLYAASESGSDRYRRLMDAAPTAFIVVSDGEVIYSNGAADVLLGPGERSIVGVDIASIVVDSRRTEFVEQMRRAEEHLGTFELEGVTMAPPGGERRIVDVTVNAVDFASGLAVQLALRDKSAQRAAESQLRETQMNYRSFFERIPVALYRSKPDGEIIQANRALVDLLGARTEDDVIGVNADDLYVDPSDREHLMSMLEEQRIVIGFESKMRRLDGASVWVRDTSRLIPTDFGDVYEGAMVDVSGRRNIEDELWSRAMQQEAAAAIGQTALETDDIGAVM
ncbi:MAG: PAS domain S-box protein, partial [Acidimicrobiia bacterium]